MTTERSIKFDKDKGEIHISAVTEDMFTVKGIKEIVTNLQVQKKQFETQLKDAESDKVLMDRWNGFKDLKLLKQVTPKELIEGITDVLSLALKYQNRIPAYEQIEAKIKVMEDNLGKINSDLEMLEPVIDEVEQDKSRYIG